MNDSRRFRSRKGLLMAGALVLAAAWIASFTGWASAARHHSKKSADAKENGSDQNPPGWLGHSTGAHVTETIPPNAPLIGFDVWLSGSREPKIDGIAPIYLGNDSPKTGPYGEAVMSPVRIVAQPGYAVAGLVGRTGGERIIGFRLIFMRYDAGVFDSKDQYQSRWLGGRGTKTDDVQLAGDGKPIAAFACSFGETINGLSLPNDADLLTSKKIVVSDALPPDKLADEVERRGGTVVRDPNDPAHPVTEINFADSQLGDADLAILRGQTSLKRLVLADGFNHFTNDGMTNLESLDNLESIDLEHNFGAARGLPVHLRGLKHLKSIGLAHSNDASGAEAESLGAIGSLERLSISDDFDDTSMDRLARLANLRFLYINDTTITNLGMQRLANFRKLQSLAVFSSVINDNGYASLESLHDLESLSLGGQELTADALSHVKAPNLKYLYLGGAGFDDRVVPYLRSMDKLESLHLRGTSLTDAGLAALNSLKNLETLDLEAGSLTGDGLSHLVDLKRLKRLDMANNPVEASALAALKNFPSLESLDLTKSKVTSGALSNLADVPKLRELNLSGVRLTDEVFAQMEPLTNLESLAMPSAHLTGDGLPHLAHLSKLKSLQLQFNPISDDNGTHLGEIKNLEHVNLEQTNAGDATMTALGKLSNLQVLAVPLTAITEHGVESLRDAKTLRDLNISNARITDAVIKTLLELRSLRVLALNYSQVTARNVQKLDGLPELRTLYLGATHVKQSTIHHMLMKSLKLKIFHETPREPDPR